MIDDYSIDLDRNSYPDIERAIRVFVHLVAAHGQEGRPSNCGLMGSRAEPWGASGRLGIHEKGFLENSKMSSRVGATQRTPDQPIAIAFVQPMKHSCRC